MDDSLLRLFRKRQLVILAILVFLSIVMLLLSTRSLTGVPERVGLTVSSFFQGIGHNVGKFFSGTVNSIGELSTLRGDYEEAMQQLSRYENLERSYADLIQENIRLKEQIGFSTDPAYKKIMSEIIAYDPGNVYSAIIINHGSLQGVKKGMPVIAYQAGVQGLVGRVVEVGPMSAMVLPVYDQSSFVAARLDESRYEGLVAGQGTSGRPLVMQYVNKASSALVKFGDVVSTSGLNGIYPKGIAIGRVTKRLDQQNKTSVEFELDSVIDFSRLEYVFIVMEIAQERLGEE